MNRLPTLGAPLALLAIGVVGCASLADAGVQEPSIVPQTMIAAGPHSVVFERHPTIGFVSSVRGSMFRCSVDGRRFVDCGSPIRLQRLGFGKHDFRVQAIAATEADPTPAEVEFRVVPRREVIGESVDGRAIVARRWGEPWQDRSMLVVGNIHGNERQGIRIVDRIEGKIGRNLRGVDLWTIETVNPDGLAANQRGNAHGVDLNRNFPYRWRSIPPSSGYYSGPRALSEPESRAVKRFVARTRPDISIWYHQPWGATLIPCNRSEAAARRYARLSGLAARNDCDQSKYPGDVITWENHALRSIAFVVEFPAGSLGETELRQHTTAALKIAEG